MTTTVPETLAALAVPIEELLPYPGNPRRHADDELRASLEHHGQYRPLVVQRSTGYVLAGNGTLGAARALGWTEIAATYVECDDDQAARIVAVDNRLSDLATYDEAALLALLGPMADLGDLVGTGYAVEDLDDLIARLQAASPDRPTVIQDDENRMSAENADRYATRTTRMIVLDLPVAVYAWAIEALNTLRTPERTSNTDVILGAIGDLVGEPPPEPEDAG